MDQRLLKDKLQTLPTKPGVYLMKDDGGEVIYVVGAIAWEVYLPLILKRAQQTIGLTIQSQRRWEIPAFWAAKGVGEG